MGRCEHGILQVLEADKRKIPFQPIEQQDERLPVHAALIIFVILTVYYNLPRHVGQVAALFGVLYERFPSWLRLPALKIGTREG